MSQSRVKNSARNIFWGMAYKLIAVVLPFFSRTIIIRWIGIEYAGISSLFTSIISILSLTELGFNTAILYSMYKTVAVGDTDKTNALLNFYKKAYRVVAFLVLAIGSLLCIKIDLFISGDIPSDINIYAIYIIFLLTSASSYSFFAYTAVLLLAHQREDISHRINIIVSLCREVIQLALLIIFRNYYFYISVALVASIVHNLVSFFVVRKKYPVYKAKGILTKDEKRSLRKSVSGLMIGKMSVVSRNSFDSIVISSFLGIIATAIYNNYYYIMFSVFGLIYYFCSGLRTSVGNKIATDSPNNNYEDMMKFSLGFFVIACFCSAIMLSLFQPFMILWVGEEYTAEWTLPVLMVVYFFLYCSTGIISQYWEGSGLFWENKTRYIIEAAANLGLNILLGFYFGLNGIILATIITMFLSSNIWGPIILFKHYFQGCSLGKYLFNQLYYSLIVFGVCLMSFSISERLLVSGFIGLVYRVAISVSISAFLIPVMLFWTKEFNQIVIFAKSIIGKYKKLSFKTIVVTLYSVLIVADIALFVCYFLFL